MGDRIPATPKRSCPGGPQRLLAGADRNDHPSCLDRTLRSLDPQTATRIVQPDGVPSETQLRKAVSLYDVLSVGPEERERGPAMIPRQERARSGKAAIRELYESPGIHIQMVGARGSQEGHAAVGRAGIPAGERSFVGIEHPEPLSRNPLDGGEVIGEMRAMDAAADDQPVQHDGPFYGTRVQRIVSETPVESTRRCRKRSITPDPPQRVRALKEMGAARVEKVPPFGTGRAEGSRHSPRAMPTL